MKSSRPMPSLPALDTLWPWMDISWKQGEMLLASAQVISHRLGRMATAGLFPVARDRKEFHRMGSEKIEAANESLMAMGMGIFESNQALFALLLAQFNAMFLASLAPGKQALPWLAGPWWSPPHRQLWENAEAVGQHFAKSAATLASQGLKPIHRRATANAVRLSAIQGRKGQKGRK